MDNKVTDNLKRHYSNKFKEFGASSLGVDWGSNTDDVILRLEKMLNIIKYDNIIVPKPSLLDVGCGYGAMLDYVNEQGIKLNYTGVDVVDEMIKYARAKHPESTFFNKDVLQIDEGYYDYIVCNGILTQKLNASIREMDFFAKKLIHKMFNMCNRGIAFNIMSDKVNYMVDNLYYKNPLEVFAMCLSDLSDKVLLDHSYKLYEYTVYVYKRN